MRILMINKFYHESGGSDTAFLRQIELLRNNGHTVFPFAMKHPRNNPSEFERFFVSPVDFSLQNKTTLGDKLRTTGRMFYSFEAKANIARLCEATQPDIAHLHNIYHQLSPSIIHSLKKKRIPIVMTVHDYKLICPEVHFLRSGGNACEACKGRYFYHAVKSKCVKNSYFASTLCACEMTLHRWLGIYRQIDMFISPSKFYADKLVDYNIIPRSKVVVLPNAVELPEPITVADEGYFLYLGRLSWKKGLLTLLKAMEVNKKAQLRLVGAGTARAEIEAFIAKRNLSNVRLMGFKDRAEINRLISKCRALVLPSLIQESCPMSILEAFAWGKPVIASHVGGVPEIVADKTDGLLFSPASTAALAQQINYLANHRSEALEMGRQARLKAETIYSFAKHYNQLQKIYRGLATDR